MGDFNGLRLESGLEAFCGQIPIGINMNGGFLLGIMEVRTARKQRILDPLPNFSRSGKTPDIGKNLVITGLQAEYGLVLRI